MHWMQWKERGAINVDIIKGENTVIIDVTDTGKGISSQNIAKVFKPGFTTKKRGWGLGLSLSKRIIEQYHKGRIICKKFRAGKRNYIQDCIEKIK